MTNQDIISRILEAEGGLQNHPEDLDGPLPTNFGITASTLSWWLGRPVTAEDMRKLTAEQAKEIYLQLYVKGPGFDRVGDPLLRYQLVDFGVLSGPHVAIRKLQEILGVEVDGKLGPLTIRALEKADAREVNNRLVKSRAEMIGRIVSQKPSQVKFLYGWLKRALKFLLP